MKLCYNIHEYEVVLYKYTKFNRIEIYWFTIFQIGLITSDDISFDLEDLKFYDAQDNEVTYSSAFVRYSAEDNDCDCDSF